MPTPADDAQAIANYTASQLAQHNYISNTHIVDIESASDQAVIDRAARADAHSPSEETTFDSELDNKSSGSKKSVRPC